VDLRVSDALFGLSFPAVRLERAGADRTQPATIDLRHVSVLASDGPVFRLDGPAPRVRVENSVFAAADRPFLLVMADDPGRLDWSGRENLYGRVASFLQLTGDDPEFPPIQRYSAWANDPDQPREFGSMATDAHVWFEDRPSDSLLGADPERAFRLVSLEGRLTKLGARQGPYGPVPAPLPASIRSDPGSVLAQESIRPVSPSAAPAEATSPNGLHPPGNVHPTPPPNGETPYTVMTEVAKGESPSSTAAASQPPASEPSVPAQRPGPTSLMPKEVEHNEPLELEEPIVVGTSAAFLDELHRLSPQGGTILIAGGTMLSLPVCEFRGEGRWKLKSERKVGENRPILMFDPKTIDGQERGVSSVWKSLFRLREGAVLQVEGIDVVLPFDPAQTNRPFAAFGIAPGTDLELIDCTVTMEGRTRPVRSATVAVRPWDDEVEAGVAANPIHSREAVVRVSDGFFRGGDDFIDVAAGRQLSLSLRNVVVSVGGVFLRGHGLARGLLASPARLGVDLRQVSCFTGNGLVHLQTVPGDSDMPVADIVARDSIVAVTDSAVPLFRVDGQEDQPHPINPIRWEGHGVAYHGVEIYRQDQSTPLGGLTVKFDRPAWQNVVGLKDEAPVHDDVHFVNPIRPGQSAWSVTRDQVRLADDTPAPRAGVDLERIPSPPSTN
jgi:serine/threonine-protein kinase